MTPVDLDRNDCLAVTMSRQRIELARAPVSAVTGREFTAVDGPGCHEASPVLAANPYRTVRAPSTKSSSFFCDRAGTRDVYSRRLVATIRQRRNNFFEPLPCKVVWTPRRS